MKRKGIKAGAPKAARISHKASTVLANQKEQWQKLVSRYAKKYGFKEGVRIAKREYRALYGKDGAERWQTALKTAAACY